MFSTRYIEITVTMSVGLLGICNNTQLCGQFNISVLIRPGVIVIVIVTITVVQVIVIDGTEHNVIVIKSKIIVTEHFNHAKIQFN